MKIADFLSLIEKENEPSGEWSSPLQALWWAKKGNWENGENILLKTKSNKTFATEHQLSEKELEIKVSKAKEILMKERKFYRKCCNY